ncbi:MAG: MATE family efflux transporter, partial [Caulobacteraceae bacterium]
MGSRARSDGAAGFDAGGGAIRPILALAAPLAAFFLVQNFASLACLAIVGRLGDAALAGLGIGGVLCGAATALLYGFDTAVQALVSRATGAGREAGAAEAATNALALSIPMAAALALALWAFGPALVGAMSPGV